MKKILISAAVVAAVGISAYLGFRPDPTPALTELQLANAEALTDIELDPVEVVCDRDGHGRCYYAIPYGIVEGNEYTMCIFTGFPTDFC